MSPLMALVAAVLAVDDRCLEQPPYDAIYKIKANDCPGAKTRISTGFRVKDVIVSTLHGVLGCKGEIVAEPQCRFRGYKEILVSPSRVAFELDLVELKPRVGALRGPSLEYAASEPAVDTLFKMCGYPAWNHSQPDCSSTPMTFQKGSINSLYSLLVDGAHDSTKKALDLYGLPRLEKQVLRYETKGGDGFSGGPVVIMPGGKSVIAVHDGRLEEGGGVVSHWGIPVFGPTTPNWQEWAGPGGGGDGQLLAVAKQVPPAKALHFALPPPTLAEPPPESEVRQFWQDVFSSIVTTYPCEWARMGAEVLNHICDEPSAPCLQRSNGDRACGLQCVAAIYNRSFGELKPAIAELCNQFAVTAGTTADALDCSKPEEFAWFNSNKSYVFKDIFFSVPMQAQLMREFYFAGVPYERRSELIAKRVASWADDAKVRGGHWRLDAAEATFEKWKAEGRSRAVVRDSSGTEFYVDPTRDWEAIVPELLLFVVNYLGSTEGTWKPACTNARLNFVSDKWKYSPDGSCDGGGGCLRFFGNDTDLTQKSKSIANALVVGSLAETQVSFDDAGYPTRTLALEVPGGIDRVDVNRLTCTETRSRENGARLKRCNRPGDGDRTWACKVDVEISEECPSVDVRLFVGGYVGQRLLLAPQ